MKKLGFCSFFIFGVCLTTLFEVCFCQHIAMNATTHFLWCIVCSFCVIFSFDYCTVVLFGLGHFVDLMVLGLILHKIYAPNISAENSDCKKKIQGITPTSKFLALISFMHEKWAGLNILGLSALIFLALVTGPEFFASCLFTYLFKYLTGLAFALIYLKVVQMLLCSST